MESSTVSQKPENRDFLFDLSLFITLSSEFPAEIDNLFEDILKMLSQSILQYSGVRNG